MKAPFVFGKIASEENFTNREDETNHLITNFSSLINTILISPRRWGKSSLVLKAADLAIKKDKSLRFCFIDLYNIRSEQEFYQVLAQEILKVSSNKIEVLLENAKTFIGKLIPKITYSPDSLNEFSLGLDWEEVKKNPESIINLAENIAIEKELKFIICIDEFQNISEFEAPLALQKKLRSHWQKHKNVSYCLYGSKLHMLMNVFTSISMPFYKFGDIIFLQKIIKEKWTPFIISRFFETGKEIKNEDAIKISTLAECHPYYVQQLAQQSWLRTDNICSSEIIDTAFESIIMQLSLLFQTITDEFSNTQLNFLKAIIKDTTHFSSINTIKEFKLGTSANVARIKQALVNKEIIDIQANKIYILDPFYKYWLKNYFFKI